MNSSICPHICEIGLAPESPIIINAILENQSPDRNFNQVLIETLDNVLLSRVEKFRQSIYNQIETQYQIGKEEIPNNIQKFANAIEKILGDAALIFEIQIMQIIHQKTPDFKFFPKKVNFSFSCYLENLQNYLRSTNL
jgi:hypothetical protein